MSEQFYKAVRHKDGRFAPEALADRFWRQVEKTDGCWIWTGVRSPAGHGRISLDGRYIQATHASLMLAGVEIPDGAFACHHCDNPPCVRPDHLYVGDPKSNVRDMLTRGRNRSKGIPRTAAKGQHNHNSKLSDAQVLAIRSAYTGRRGEQSSLAREYGVTPQLIQMIVKGARAAARAAEAIIVRDLITPEQFEILTGPMRAAGIDFDTFEVKS